MPKKKVLSLRQPWASLVASGAKQYETRSWKTGFRGELFIHAAKALTAKDLEFWKGQPYYREWLLEYYGSRVSLPRGCVIAAVELTAVYKSEELRPHLSETEFAFGNYAPNRFAFRLESVRPIEPIPLRGQLGLFDWEPEQEVIYA